MTASKAPLLAARTLLAVAGDTPVDFVHVLTRLRTPDPRDRSQTLPARGDAELRNLPGLTYRQVVLGWMIEPSGSRWLTNEEIAEGVVGVIDSGVAIGTIGQTEPIESNPCGTGRLSRHEGRNRE